jgi:hypothetical protein
MIFLLCILTKKAKKPANWSECNQRRTLCDPTMMNSPSWWNITMTALIFILKRFSDGCKAAHRLRKKKTDSDSSRLLATLGSHPMLPTMAKMTKRQCRILLCALIGCTIHAMDRTSEKVTSLKSDEAKREWGISVGYDRNQKVLMGGEFGETTCNDGRFCAGLSPYDRTMTWFHRRKRIGGAKQYWGTKTTINQGAHGGYCCCVCFLERRSQLSGGQHARYLWEL